MPNILTKLSIISAILGITLLIIISDKIVIPSSDISSIDKQDINKHIKVNGIVKKMISKGGITILELEDKTSTIKVVLFKPGEIKLKKGSFVEVEGKIGSYEDSPEIIAETIKT